MHKHISPQGGNVLFLILIAIALFAALSYAVTNMMRGGSPTAITDDKAGIFAAEILDYGRSLRAAVQGMRINGCDDTDISFGNDIIGGYTHSPASIEACQIFNAGGGAMTYNAPDDDWLASITPAPTLRGVWYFPANTCVQGIGSGENTCASDGVDNEDIIAILPYIKAEICTTINRRLNLGAASLSETGDGWPDGADKFTGTFGDDAIINQNGFMAGCFEGSGANTPAAGTYHFYQVLRAR